MGIDAEHVANVRQALIDFGDAYLRRVFTPRELEDCAEPGTELQRASERLAARFAAKEATLKVLRVDQQVPLFTEMEVISQPGGWTSLELTGTARALADEAGLRWFEVSLTHTPEIAVAIVSAEETRRACDREASG